MEARAPWLARKGACHVSVAPSEAGLRSEELPGEMMHHCATHRDDCSEDAIGCVGYCGTELSDGPCGEADYDAGWCIVCCELVPR